MATEEKAVETTAVEKKPAAKKTASTAEKKPAAKKTTAAVSEKKAPAKKPAAPKKAVEAKVETAAEVKKEAPAKKAPAAKKTAGKTVAIRLIKGFSGRLDKQIDTCKSLGLRKIGDKTVQPDNAATRGKLAKISHMVEVTEG